VGDDTLVKVENVSKRFCRSLKRSLWYGVCDLGNELVGKQHADPDKLRKNEFWAINDISFELKRGECLGLIGRNGAGKTTLLRVLNGLIKPDKGRVELKGRVGALIALGAGFNPILTGRENIYINGAVLGLTKKHITSKLDEIIEFSEIDEFIDSPVQSYSSGMKIRLGFAIAAKLIKPDILFLDEVLAVGDAGFRSKCYTAVSDMLENAAVIFVSHIMTDISRLASKVALLEHGKSTFIGETSSGINLYNSLLSADCIQKQSLGTGEAVVSNVALITKSDIAVDTISYGNPFDICFDLKISEIFEQYIMSLTFMDQAHSLVAEWHSNNNGVLLKNDGKVHHHMISFNKLLLNPGKYFLNLVILDKNSLRPLCWELALLKFSVIGQFTGTSPVQLIADHRFEKIADK